jgi:hypothetical protein
VKNAPALWLPEDAAMKELRYFENKTNTCLSMHNQLGHNNLIGWRVGEHQTKPHPGGPMKKRCVKNNLNFVF